MPYVEGFGTWPFGEEWLWEAVACVYLPLLELLDGAPGHDRADAGAVRPARGHARRARRPLPGFLREIRAADPRRGRRPDSSAAASTSWPPRCAAPRATTSSPTRPSSTAAATCSGRSPRSSGSSCGPRARPTRCCRCSPPTPACACSWPPARPPTCGASAAGAAASGCRSAPMRRGWSATWPTTACARSASTRRRCRASTTCARSPPRPGRWPCRSTGRRSSWSGTTATATRSHGTYRDYHRRTVHDLKPWNNAGHPYDREAAIALAREHARDFVERAARAGRRGRAALLRARHRAARPLVVRGAGLAGGGARGGAAPGAGAGHGQRGHRARRARSGRSSRPRPGAPARTCPPGTRLRVGQHRVRRAPLGAAHRRGHRRPRGAARGAGARRPRAARRAGERLGVHGHARAGRRLPARAPRGATAPGSDAAPWPALTDLRRRAAALRPQPRPRSRPGRADLALMRALILSWEYPPLIEGGLARHVRKLAENLAAQDVDVHVLARGRDERPPEEEAGGVLIHRVREPERPRDLGEFVAWIEHMNSDMLAAGVEVGDRYDFDVVHGHDWLVASAGHHLANRFRAPARGHDPRDRVRAPPGLGRQAPAVVHPRRGALDGQPRRAGDHLLGLHARARGRHLRARGVARGGDPQRHRPLRAGAGRRPRHAARALRRSRTRSSSCWSAGSSTRRASSSRSRRCPG